MIETLTKKQVAQHLKVSPRTVDRWVRAGLFPPPAKIGDALRWRREDVDKHVQSCFEKSR